jgi:uncharacterized protein
MSAIPSDTLVIVAKYPEPGQVKTRLGAVIGASHAAALYSAFLRDLAARFDAPGAPWTLRWACAPSERPPEALCDIIGQRGQIFVQRGPDFADRLYHIGEDAQALGARRLVIMSSDAPQLSAALVADAFAALAESDVAISPAEDGGYSLIGLRLPETPAAPPDLFRGVHMSATETLAETLQRAAALGLSVTQLAPTFDVDEAADLGRLWLALRDAPALAPRSYAALAALVGDAGAVLHPGNEDSHGHITTH